MGTATMKAAVFKGNGILKVEDVPIPEVTRDNDVLIRVEAASICGSDLHVLHVPPGQYAEAGIIMGHEFMGTVEKIGVNAKNVQVGDRVVVDPIQNCGNCPECKQGRYNLCLNAVVAGQTRHGGFAEYSIQPCHKLHKIPQDIPARIAAQTEPLSCVMNAILKLNPMPHEHVLLFGAGAIGLTFIRVLKLFGIHNLIVCDALEKSRKHAERCGAELVYSADTDLAQVMRKKWNSYADIVIDAVGAGNITEQALKLLQPAARFLIFGQNANTEAVIHPADIVRNELIVMGSYCTRNTFPIAIETLQNQDLHLELLIGSELPLEQINLGIEQAKTKDAARVIIYTSQKAI